MGAPSSRVCCHSRWAITAGSMPADFHHASLIAMPVNGPMVGAAERNGEFVADPAPHGSRLHEPQMVSVRRLPSAQKARLRRHELQMGAVAIAARFAEGKGAFVDMPEDGVVHRRCLGLRRCGSVRQRGRLGWCRRRRLLRTPPLAPAPLRREGRFLGAADLHAGAQGGHELSAAGRLGRFRRTLAGFRRRGQ